jgi:predicted HicB family RNase H-like nuclease
MASVQIDEEAGLLHGEVLNTRDVITFQADTVAQARREFVASVEDYLAFCAERGEAPEKPMPGEFVVRVGPDTHRRLHLAAKLSGQSLSAWATDKLAKAAARELSGRGAVPIAPPPDRPARRRGGRKGST